MGEETEVGLPQSVDVAAGEALVRVDAGDDVATAAGGLEPIPVATPIGTPVLPPKAFPTGRGDESSNLMPADAAGMRRTEAVGRNPPPPPPPAPPPAEELAPSPGPSASSSRRASAQSSRRVPAAGRSSRRLSATSGRTLFTDPTANLRSLMWIGIGILAVVIAVVAVIVLATHHSEGRQRGAAVLAEAQRQLETARDALAGHRPAEARQAYAAAIAGLAKEPALAATPGDKQAVPELAQRAAALRSEIDALTAPLVQAESAAAVDANLAGLRNRFARLGDAATDLDSLEADAKAYCANPVDPKGAPDAEAAGAFPQQVGEVRLRVAEIATERNRRHIERAVAPVDRLRPAILELIAQEHYGDALARIAAAKTASPDSDFAPLSEAVDNAVASAWRSAKNYAETRIADWKSPGATAEQRTRAVADAKRRLNLVIDSFGVPEYVDQAKAMLAGLP